jgi:hypothetical protein
MIPARLLLVTVTASAIACTWLAGVDASGAEGAPQRRARGGSDAAAAPVNVPSKEERAAARQEYNDARRAVHRDLAGRGCKATPADIDVIADRLAKELQPLASRGMFGMPDFRFELNNTRRAACDVEKNGPIPAFERALEAMVDGRRLDPCTYDPADTTGLAAIVDDPLYLMYNSRRDYDSASFGTQNYLHFVYEDERRGECFLNLIRSKLTGRPWTPSGQASNATFTPAERRTPRPAPGSARTTATAPAVVSAPVAASAPAAASAPTPGPAPATAAAPSTAVASAPATIARASDLPPSPADGGLAAFEAGTATLSVALSDGTMAAFVVDEDTTITDAAGVAHLLLRSGTQYLTTGIRVSVQWTAAPDDRALALRITVLARR